MIVCKSPLDIVLTPCSGFTELAWSRSSAENGKIGSGSSEKAGIFFIFRRGLCVVIRNKKVQKCQMKKRIIRMSINI